MLQTTCMSISRFHNILNDRKNGSITIALNALNALREIPEQSDRKGSLMFNLMMNKRKEMSILVNLGRIGINMINMGYSLHYICDLLIEKLKEDLQKSSINASLATIGCKNFLTISKSEQLLSFFSHLEINTRVFVLKTYKQPEGSQLISSISRMGINCSAINYLQLDKMLEEIDCLIVGSDSVMPSAFSNRIGTMYLIARMISVGKPSYVLTMSLKISDNKYISLLDSRNFELIPNRLITKFCTDIGNIGGKFVYNYLVQKASLSF